MITVRAINRKHSVILGAVAVCLCLIGCTAQDNLEIAIYNRLTQASEAYACENVKLGDNLLASFETVNDRQVQALIRIALNRLSYNRSSPKGDELQTIIMDVSPKPELLAVDILGRSGDRKAVRPLLALLGDDDILGVRFERYCISRALCRLGDVRGVPLVLDYGYDYQVPCLGMKHNYEWNAIPLNLPLSASDHALVLSLGAEAIPVLEECLSQSGQYPLYGLGWRAPWSFSHRERHAVRAIVLLKELRAFDILRESRLRVPLMLRAEIDRALQKEGESLRKR